jgi:hypothetical protein
VRATLERLAFAYADCHASIASFLEVRVSDKFKWRLSRRQFLIPAALLITTACASDSSPGDEKADVHSSVQNEETDTPEASDERFGDPDDVDVNSDGSDESSDGDDQAGEDDETTATPVPCPVRSHTLVGGGRTFGFCATNCSYELLFEAASAQDECGTYGAVVALKDSQNRDVLTRYRAKLTDAAWQESERLGLALAQETLKQSYGCFDCLDGGTSWVTTRGLDAALPHYYDWGIAPAVLAEADGFVQELIDQIRACQGGAWVSACEELAP